LPADLARAPAAPTLLNGGFIRLGSWRADPQRPGALALDGEVPHQPGVYAFACSGQVMYVGSAQRGLRTRLRRYAITQTLRTSARVRALILERLGADVEVTVLAARPPSLWWQGLPIDPIAGLEEGLIKAFAPAWNIRGKPDRDAPP
jgi:excinuclease UvrABC nuclease subunit